MESYKVALLELIIKMLFDIMVKTDVRDSKIAQLEQKFEEIKTKYNRDAYDI